VEVSVRGRGGAVPWVFADSGCQVEAACVEELASDVQGEYLLWQAAVKL